MAASARAEHVGNKNKMAIMSKAPLLTGEPDQNRFTITSTDHPDFECSAVRVSPALKTRPDKHPNRSQIVMQHLKRLMNSADIAGGQFRSTHHTLELVAQSFHAVLQDDSLSPLTRVWFTRLQLPVMRAALADPVDFQNPDHPAQRLLARIGSCAVGMGTCSVPCGELEQEIIRLVLLVERFPSVDRQVFEWAGKEFDAFLAKFQNGHAAQSAVDCAACQDTQKDALATQYRIAIRDKLNSEPIQNELRDFLLQVWSEILARSAVLKGLEHDNTLALKRTAVELIRINTALHRRRDRNRAIGQVPRLVQQLRHGMNLLGLSTAEQDEHIKKIGTNLTDAFLTERPDTDSQNTERRTSRRHPRNVGLHGGKTTGVDGLHVIDDDADIAWRLWECALVEQELALPPALPESAPTPSQTVSCAPTAPSDFRGAYAGDKL